MNKRFFYLLIGYIFGNIIASLYSSKSGESVKNDMKEAKKDGDFQEIRVLFKYLVGLHEKLFSDIASEDNKKQATDFLDATGKKVQDFVQPYTPEIKKIVQHYKGIGEKEAEELTQKIQNFISSSFDSGVSYLKTVTKKEKKTSPLASKIVKKSKTPRTTTRVKKTPSKI